MSEVLFRPPGEHYTGSAFPVNNSLVYVRRTGEGSIRVISWDRKNVKKSIKILLKAMKAHKWNEIHLGYHHKEYVDGRILWDLLHEKGFTCTSSSYPEGSGAHPVVLQFVLKEQNLIGRSLSHTSQYDHTAVADKCLSFRNIEYEFENHLAPEPYEGQPRIHFFLSHLPGDGTYYRLDLFDHNGKSKNKEQGILSFDLPMFYAPTDLEMVNLNVHCYCNMLNDADKVCVNQAGCAQVTLATLLAMDKDSELIMDLRIPMLKTVVKGILKLRLSSDHGEISIGSLRDNHHDYNLENHYIMTSIGKNIFNQTDEERTRYLLQEGQQLVREYCNELAEFYREAQPTYSSLLDIHTYHYDSALTRLPSASFYRAKCPPTSSEYWENLIRIALERIRSEYGEFGTGNPEAPTFEEYSEGGLGTPRLHATVLAICLTLYVNCCEYITDIVDGNDRQKSSKHMQRLMTLVESFDNITMREAGDCEDDSKESNIQAASLRRLRSEMGAYIADIVKQQANILDKFYIFGALSGVAAREINEDYDHAKMSAHEHAILIPKRFFLQCLERGSNISRKTSDLNSQILQYVQNDVRTNTTANDDELDVLICEGTGMLWPISHQKNNPSLAGDVETILQSAKPMKDYRKFFNFDLKQGSNFYKTISTLFTNDFFFASPLTSGIGEFVMAYPNSSKPQGYTYGVDFKDIIRKTSKFVIIAAPAFSNDLVDYIDLLQRDEHPFRQLPEPHITTEENVDFHQTLIRKHLDPFLRHENKPFSKLIYSTTRFLNYRQFDDEHLSHLANSLRNVARTTHHKVQIDVFNEPITMDETREHLVGVFRFVIYVYA